EPVNGNNLEEWRKSRLSRALSAGAEEVAKEWECQLTGAAFGLMEHPGRRVAAAEAALDRFGQFCQRAAAAHGSRREQQVVRTQQAWQQLQRALENYGAGGDR